MSLNAGARLPTYRRTTLRAWTSWSLQPFGTAPDGAAEGEPLGAALALALALPLAPALPLAAAEAAPDAAAGAEAEAEAAASADGDAAAAGAAEYGGPNVHGFPAVAGVHAANPAATRPPPAIAAPVRNRRLDRDGSRVSDSATGTGRGGWGFVSMPTMVAAPSTASNGTFGPFA